MLLLNQNVCIVLISIAICIGSPSSLHIKKVLSYNKIINVKPSCDSNFFNTTLQLEQPFKGAIFAKEFSQECKTIGNSSTILTLNLPASGCGVSLSRDEESQKMYYMITVILQQDKFLRQISDEEKKIKCYLTDDTFQVKSKNMESILKNLVHDVNRSARKGRMRTGWTKNADKEPLQIANKTFADALKAARAWMEIVPAKEDKNSGILKVGEPAFLIVKSTLPVGIGWKVVDCIAHDGLGDSSQKLLDEDGCPVDELLLPALLKKPARPIALMKHQEAVSKFAAFKFPDRDRLHLSCSLQLCKNACSQVNCLNQLHSPMKDNRLGRTLGEGLTEDILDKLEVFNSVEVKAPEIELEDYVNFETNYGKYTSPFGVIPGDRTFCVSSSNMALSFCLLGLIFLCALFVAAWSLLRARRSGTNIPFYTRSLFSSSIGSGYGGNKLLLQESPCMAHHSRSIHSYGRMF